MAHQVNQRLASDKLASLFSCKHSVKSLTTIIKAWGLRNWFPWWMTTVESVSIRNAAPVVLRRIAEAIKQRLEHQQLQETLQTLVTAQHVHQSQSLGKA